MEEVFILIFHYEREKCAKVIFGLYLLGVNECHQRFQALKHTLENQLIFNSAHVVFDNLGLNLLNQPFWVFAFKAKQNVV